MPPKAREEVADDSKISITLLFSEDDGRIIYAEAEKDFLDLMLWMLQLPVGTVIKLLKNRGDEPFGGIVNLYQSLETLKPSALQTEKNVLLNPSVSIVNPKMLSFGAGQAQRSALGQPNQQGVPKFCPYCRSGLQPNQQRPYCGVECPGNAQPVQPSFLKENLTFIVTNSLEFFPSKTIRSIEILSNTGVRMASLKSLEIAVDEDLGLHLLRSAMSSTTVLQDVFGEKVKGKLPRRTVQ